MWILEVKLPTLVSISLSVILQYKLMVSMNHTYFKYVQRSNVKQLN